MPGTYRHQSDKITTSHERPREQAGQRHRWRRGLAGLGIATLLATAGSLASTTPVHALPSDDQAGVSVSPDATASVNGRVRVVAYHNNTLYVGGDFTRARYGGKTYRRHHVAAINATTGKLLAWNPRANGDVEALAVDKASNKVYIGGDFSKVGGKSRVRLARVNGHRKGSVNKHWSHSANKQVRALTVANGRVYAGGFFTKIDGKPRQELAAFSLATGGLGSKWKPSAVGGMVHAIAATKKRVYIGAEADTLNGHSQFGNLGAVNPNNGSTISAFSSHVSYRVYQIAVGEHGVYAAADGKGGHLRAFRFDGSNRWDLTADGAFEAVTIYNHQLYVGGHFDHICNTNRVGSHGDCLDGQVQRKKLALVGFAAGVQSWAPQANSVVGVVSLAHNSPRGLVAAGGDFTAFNFGQDPQPHVAQFSS